MEKGGGEEEEGLVGTGLSVPMLETLARSPISILPVCFPHDGIGSQFVRRNNNNNSRPLCGTDASRIKKESKAQI